VIQEFLRKKVEKIEKYNDLRRELSKERTNVKTKIVSIFIGALGTVTKGLNCYLTEIVVSTKIQLIQKSLLLGTTRIFRMVLEI